MEMIRNTGKLAVITGASSGIGKAIALAWIAEGGQACLLGRDEKRLEEVAAVARESVSKISCLQVDLAEEGEIRTVCQQIQKGHPQIDLLVHCAGVSSLGKVEDAPVETFDLQYRVNVRAPYLLTQLLLPAVRSAQGQVVFVNSSAGLSAGSFFSQYAATKHALKAVADSFRHEVNEDGLRVVSVYPGRTASPMQADVCRMEGQPYHPEKLLQPEDVASVVIHAISLPSSAEVTDIKIRPMNKS
jgi:NADP-dependent 3-hydroxy acid dehydrogenase YdfG